MLGMLRKLHAWTGLGLCLFIALVSFTGAALSLKPEWLRATTPGAAAAPDLRPVALARVLQGAEAGFGRGQVGSVTFASDEFGLSEVYLRDGGGGYVDANGRVVRRWGENERIVDIAFALHRKLLLGDMGATVVGWLGVVLAVMIVVGVVLWWPSRRSFTARLAPGPGRTGWLSAHRDLGVMVAPLGLALALTGAGLALPDLARRPIGATVPPAPKLSAPFAGEPDWRALLAAATAALPEAKPRMAVFPKKAAAASIRLRQPHEWHANGRSIVYLDPADATVLSVVDDQIQPAGVKAFNSFWPIHAGRTGGLAYRIVLALAGLALTALSLYGAEAYRRRLVRFAHPGRATGGPPPAARPVSLGKAD
jgi:uncharacterized iron-regulated membrane protein